MRISNYIQFQNRQIKVLYLATLVLFLPLFGALYFLYSQDSKNETPVIQVEEVEKIPVSLNSVQTTAHAAFVVSLNTNEVLYQKNPDKQLPLASITKLITAKVAEDRLSSETLEIHKMQEYPEYGDANLREGETWQADELIDYTLVTSSNDGAHTLTRNSSDFTKAMNALATSAGAFQTQFYNESGLDDDLAGVPGSKGTAQDVSKILSYLIKSNLPMYEKTQHSQISVSTPTGLRLADNTNEVTNQITGLLVSKTGYTDLAGGNLAIVADMGLNEPVAFVVLKSSKESRFDDVLKLQEEYFAQVRQNMR